MATNINAERKRIQRQIEKLQKQDADLLKKTKSPVIKKMISDMRQYNITPEDIATEYAKGRPKASSRKPGTTTRGAVKNKSTVPAKYCNPETGETWTGRGRTPRWMADAEAAGQARESFTINEKTIETPALEIADNKGSSNTEINDE